MISISTIATPDRQMFVLAEQLRRINDTETKLELFFDSLPFLGGTYYHAYIADFILAGRLGMHCPIVGCDLLAPSGTLEYQYTIDRHKECFALAEELHIPYVVVHTNSPAPLAQAELPQKLALLTERLPELAELAKQYGCDIWVENVGMESAANLVATQQAYAELIRSCEAVYSLVDLGHAHINGWDIPSLLDELGERIRGLHFHDNDGFNDQHLPVFQGNLDWDSVFPAVSRLPHPCELILEYHPNAPLEALFEACSILRQRIR